MALISAMSQDSMVLDIAENKKKCPQPWKPACQEIIYTSCSRALYEELLVLQSQASTGANFSCASWDKVVTQLFYEQGT